MAWDVGRLAERAMAMDDAAWARHANPWSGWSRVAVLPLLALAVWSRVWIGWWALGPVALMLAWTWANPRAFGPPASTANWMSQGVLGERIWLARTERPIPAHHARAAAILNAVSGAGALVMIWGLVVLSPGAALGGMAVAMLGKLWFLDRMVWLKAEVEGQG